MGHARAADWPATAFSAFGPGFIETIEITAPIIATSPNSWNDGRSIRTVPPGGTAPGERR
uniref:Uncharacterized protein n=1 Tax=Brevibacterium sp. Ap13 TaxID=1406197 RepID=U5NZC5_9MICO|nr:hypothetical protein AP13_p00900 [Brevibacterium sp. Ap13]